MFKNPSMFYRSEEKEAYLNALNKLWDERDTPILRGLLKSRADKFKTEVIDTLLPG